MQIQTREATHNGTSIAQPLEKPVTRSETRAQMMRVTPAVDIFESDEELRLLADLPGVSNDAIDLRVDRGVLSLTATDEARHRVYRRAFTLSDTVDPSGVEAELKDGVLTVHLKKREDMKPRRVEIRAGG